MQMIKKYIPLHMLLLFYSFCSVFSKLASTQEFMSGKFVLYYFFSLIILGIYAILWQQALKKIPLTTAFINKAITVVWGMILGLVFFHEKITFQMVIGALVILIGISLVIKNE